MELRKVIPYIDIKEGDEHKLISFFEDEEVRSFLIDRWDRVGCENIDDAIDESESDRKEDIVLQTSNDETITTKPDDMPLIPNIPDDEDTKKLIGGTYQDPKDEALLQSLTNKFIQLQNAKVNQPYSFQFSISNLGIESIGNCWFEGLDEIGLSFDQFTGLIEGIPTKAGDHKIKLKCQRDTWQEGDPIFEKSITLIVNPDPRALWNNIPTPQDIEYYRPDSDCKYVKVETTNGFLGFGRKERKDIVAASQRGRSHAHEGTPRDDDFSISFDAEGNWYTMIVADGAGSAKYSRAGAHIACTTVSEVCSSQFAKYNKDVDDLVKDFNKENSEGKRKKLGDALYNIIGSAVFKAFKNIEKESQDKGATMRDYATTLLVTVAKKFKFGWFVASFWIGDGAIAIYNKESQYLKIMGEADGGEFAGQTRFLTMPEIMQPTEIYRRLRFEIIEDFTALILMSDGVSDPKFETDSNLLKIDKWNALWDDISTSVELTDDNEESAEQLLKWLDFWSPGNHDDRTIAILY